MTDPAGIYWCPKCGIVWAVDLDDRDERPVCPDRLRRRVADGCTGTMEQLPLWHPFAVGVV